MIRGAKSTDAFALTDLLADLHAETHYQTERLDAAYARKLFAQIAHRHGGKHDGGTCLYVYEHDGKIVGMVAGMIDRIYGVGESLWTGDLFLHVRKDAPARALNALLRAFIGWSEGNPNVMETRVSTSDAAGDYSKLGALYERMGFVECGRTYRRANPNFTRKADRMAA